ncbi:MAG: response regulator [Marinobacter sp.]
MAVLKALVVDDASFVRDLVKRTLRQRFPVMEMAEAHNGRVARSLMSRNRFDLILCDWEMPEMTGLELLQWMRSDEHYRRVPFIMITSRGDKSHVVEAVQEGVSEYLGKPFSPEGLSKKVIKVMGRTLQKAMAEDGRTPSAAMGAFRESADLLTRKPAKAAAAARAGTTPRPERNSRLVMAAIRFSDSTLKCVIKDITLTEVRVIARRDQVFPGILDQAVVDMEVAEGRVARLNGYVHQLQAVDKRLDTDFVSVTVRFVDDDPKKLEDLSHFIADFRR